MAQETPTPPIETYEKYKDLDSIQECLSQFSNQAVRLYNFQEGEDAIGEMITRGHVGRRKLRSFDEIFIDKIESDAPEPGPMRLIAIRVKMIQLVYFVRNSHQLAQEGNVSVDFIPRILSRIIRPKEKAYPLTKEAILKAAYEGLKLATQNFKDIPIPEAGEEYVRRIREENRESVAQEIGDREIPNTRITMEKLDHGVKREKRDEILNDCILLYQIVRLAVEGGGEAEELLK